MDGYKDLLPIYYHVRMEDHVYRIFFSKETS